jgi:hypothetical protein
MENLRGKKNPFETRPPVAFGGGEAQDRGLPEGWSAGPAVGSPVTVTDRSLTCAAHPDEGHPLGDATYRQAEGS